MLGFGNQRIITALVGLDAIKRGIVVSAPDDFPATWNPKNRSASAAQSRILILEMALVRSVDALDTYLRWINRKPFLVQCGNTRCELDRAGLSVSRRFQVIEEHFPPPGRILSALAVTMIGWRNKAVHREYSKELKNTYRQILEQQSDEVADRFCGLNTDILLEGYRTNRIPHLKEVTSFISATHEYVQELDGIMLSLLEPEQYLKELVWAGVCENDTDGGRNVRERKRLIHSKWACESP